jgi:hypothetical protein
MLYFYSLRSYFLFISLFFIIFSNGYLFAQGAKSEQDLMKFSRQEPKPETSKKEQVESTLKYLLYFKDLPKLKLFCLEDNCQKIAINIENEKVIFTIEEISHLLNEDIDVNLRGRFFQYYLMDKIFELIENKKIKIKRMIN